MPSTRKLHLLASLLTACLVATLVAPSQTWAASGLNCEVTIPQSAQWSDYFDQVGDSIFFDDDECGMSVPVGPGGGRPDDGSVAINMTPSPHQSYARFFVLGSNVEIGSGSHVTVFRMADTQNGVYPMVEIRLSSNVFGGRILQLVVTDDSEITKTYALGLAHPNGNVVHIEVAKSTHYEAHDAFVSVDIHQGAGSELLVDSLEIWDRVPTEVRFGAVQSTGSAGNLTFQPMEFGQRFFSASPQG